MLRMMADENMEEWGHGVAIVHETVRSVVEAHAAGRIDLGPVPEDTPSDKVRWAPSFVQGVLCPPGERRPRPYTAGTVRGLPPVDQGARRRQAAPAPRDRRPLRAGG